MIRQYPFRSVSKIHFIGIGGIGMSGIARILHNLGYTISGSDQTNSQNVKELKALGIKVNIGHREKYLGAPQVVVTSNAISPANEELLAAKEKRIPVIHRGEMLAELMRLKFGISVAGTHGKTTTTALATAICIGGGLRPTSVIGGKWVGINSNAKLGKDKYLICEADESDGSFLKLSPVVGIVTNIDKDHLDFYKTEEKLLSYFLNYLNNIPFYGQSIICIDDPYIKRIASSIQKPYVTYGLSEESHIRGSDLKYEKGSMLFNVHQGEVDLGVFSLGLLGEHNVLNALAAICLGLELGIKVSNMKKTLKNFKGVNRRMSVLGNYHGYVVMDDYGHHPTELLATIKAVRYKFKKVIVIFQPHRYTRTLNHYKDFAKALSIADEVYITDIYSAGEELISGVTSELIYRHIQSMIPTHYFKKSDDLCRHFWEHHKKDEGVVMTIGAGDVYQIAQKIAKK